VTDVMLGEIVERLTTAATAEDLVTAIAQPRVLERIRSAATAEGVTVGSLVASRLRHVIEHGAPEMWLDLLSTMSGSPQPGSVAADRLLALAFPDPVRVRISRTDTHT